MANIDQLAQRNKEFAATCAHEEASIIARHPVYVITCLDPRTDPSASLELKLGDAMVVRNADDVTTSLVTTTIPAAPMHPRMSSLTPESAGAPSF